MVVVAATMRHVPRHYKEVPRHHHTRSRSTPVCATSMWQQRATIQMMDRLHIHGQHRNGRSRPGEHLLGLLEIASILNRAVTVARWARWILKLAALTIRLPATSSCARFEWQL